VVTCNRAALDPDVTSQITIDMTLPTGPGMLSNSATVSSATSEAAAGDESDSASVEVLGPPTIVDVTSVGMTEHASLLTDTSTTATLTQIHLEASHELFDDTGHAGATDVTNPGCYRLFRADAEGDFGSTTCSDETHIAVVSAGYGEAGERIVALTLGGSTIDCSRAAPEPATLKTSTATHSTATATAPAATTSCSISGCG
jgi:hypothetical protein